LKPGDYVKQGQIIGRVGCSGTNGAYKDSKLESHLHFEIRIDSKFLGEGLPYKQVYELYRGVFNLCL
jgi:murein DD-endopeptidase MepM/ murein hydrolase activator NlpD